MSSVSKKRGTKVHTSGVSTNQYPRFVHSGKSMGYTQGSPKLAPLLRRKLPPPSCMQWVYKSLGIVVGWLPSPPLLHVQRSWLLTCSGCNLQVHFCTCLKEIWIVSFAPSHLPSSHTTLPSPFLTTNVEVNCSIRKVTAPLPLTQAQLLNPSPP